MAYLRPKFCPYCRATEPRYDLEVNRYLCDECGGQFQYYPRDPPASKERQ